MTEPNTEPQTLTVYLSGRPPVEIDPQAWPVLAEVSAHDAQHAFQAFRTWRVTVRRHADGRHLVHGCRQSAWQHEPPALYAGQLVPAGADLAAAVEAVAQELGRPDLAQRALDALPPQPLA